MNIARNSVYNLVLNDILFASIDHKYHKKHSSFVIFITFYWRDKGNNNDNHII